nr:FAD-dependent oxidoreductase [Saprospiraceae bacterium]
NDMMREVTGIENYFELKKQNISDGFHNLAIFMKEEGRLNPKKMMDFLYQKAIEHGVHFLNDYIETIDQNEHAIYLKKYGKIAFKKCGITLNGYIHKLLPETTVRPARNLVMITNDMPSLTWDHVVHYNQGYVYFRRIGDKILIGGGRNIDKDREYTSVLEVNTSIESYLSDFLKNKICINHPVEIIHQYVGILGFDDSKIPKVVPHSDSIGIASGMGGMGVAIGSQIGKELADFLVK